ncbi:MAG: hypothetical protein ACRCU5_08150 [Rhizobiaceae bacterium]
MRISSVSSILFAFAAAGLAGCTTTGGDPVRVVPVVPAVEAAIAVPCQEAAGDKYFMDPDRVIALSSSSQGANTVVVMKADVRDAVCTLNSKGKVVSLVDTTPKSADQAAADEAKALAGEVPTGDAVVPKKKKKKS